MTAEQFEKAKRLDRVIQDYNSILDRLSSMQQVIASRNMPGCLQIACPFELFEGNYDIDRGSIYLSQSTAVKVLKSIVEIVEAEYKLAEDEFNTLVK